MFDCCNCSSCNWIDSVVLGSQQRIENREFLTHVQVRNLGYVIENKQKFEQMLKRYDVILKGIAPCVSL